MSETMACTIVKPFLYSATLTELLKNTEVLHKPCQMKLIKEVLIQKYDRNERDWFDRKKVLETELQSPPI
jgi:hypothetical protein